MLASPAVLALHSEHHTLLAHLAGLGQPGLGGEPGGKEAQWTRDQRLDGKETLNQPQAPSGRQPGPWLPFSFPLLLLSQLQKPNCLEPCAHVATAASSLAGHLATAMTNVSTL